ncbi:hypothetical protein TNCV_3032751 [Trichonephila clavipes]|nr:hypothetical protein TNCV_3032751 [Trichonephila clavipes]
MAVDDRTTSTRQLAVRWLTATGVLMSASSIHRCLMHRVAAGESCLSECVTERHCGLTHGVMVCGAISHHGRYK